MPNKLIIANWKAYLKATEVMEILHAVIPHQVRNDVDIIIAPSPPYLALIRSKSPDITLAAQDVSAIADKYGAYTGELPAIMLADMGVKYAIIGHSERRSNGLDNEQIIALKVRHALAVGIKPIICVGETRAERDGGKYLDIVAGQLRSLNILEDVDIIVAYEPSWSVGTGLVPSSDEISEMMNLIRSTLGIARKVKLVYGGSVSAENAKDIVNIPGVDGVLIGKASTDAMQFKEIIRRVS